MKTKRIVGNLHPTNEGSVNTQTPYNIYDAIEENSLGRIIYLAEGWSEGVVTIDTTYHVPSDAVIDVAKQDERLAFLGSVAKFIRAEGVNELGLEGTIEFSLKDTDGSVDAVTLFVHRGTVEYRKASVLAGS